MEKEWIKLLKNGDALLENIPVAEWSAAVCLAAGVILLNADYKTKEDGKCVFIYPFLCEKDNRKWKVAVYAQSTSEALLLLLNGGYTALEQLCAATL